jgi:hypothetical protein
MTLKQRAEQIKNETAEGGNTATRVGGLLEDITESFVGVSDTGWVQINDTQYTEESPFTVSEGSTVVLPNNGGNTIDTYIPSDTNELYSVSDAKFTPTNIGDAYVIAVRFRAKSSKNFGGLKVGIDIGGELNTFVQQSEAFIREANTEQYFNMVFNLFTLDTFVANGGQIKFTAITGDMEVYEIRYVITRVFKPNL